MKTVGIHITVRSLAHRLRRQRWRLLALTVSAVFAGNLACASVCDLEAAPIAVRTPVADCPMHSKLARPTASQEGPADGGRSDDRPAEHELCPTCKDRSLQPDAKNQLQPTIAILPYEILPGELILPVTGNNSSTASVSASPPLPIFLSLLVLRI